MIIAGIGKLNFFCRQLKDYPSDSSQRPLSLCYVFQASVFNHQQFLLIVPLLLFSPCFIWSDASFPLISMVTSLYTCWKPAFLEYLYSVLYLFFTANIATVEKMLTIALLEHDPGSAQDWRPSSDWNYNQIVESWLVCVLCLSLVVFGQPVATSLDTYWETGLVCQDSPWSPVTVNSEHLSGVSQLLQRHIISFATNNLSGDIGTSQGLREQKCVIELNVERQSKCIFWGIFSKHIFDWFQAKSRTFMIEER